MHSWRTQAGIPYIAIGTVESLRVWEAAEREVGGLPDLYTVTPSSGFTTQTDFAISGAGFGALDYGEDYYGTAREYNEASMVAPVWSFANFGDDLLAVANGDGKLWHWDQSNGTSTGAVQITDAGTQLTGLEGVLVTSERHVLVLAPGGDRRKIRWSTQDGGLASADWTPSTTNTARAITLATQGEVLAARQTRYGVLVFTTTDVFRLEYVGPPYVYNAERIGEAVGPIGANSIAGSADFIAWVSQGRMYSYTGGYLKELPCDVGDYVFSDINIGIAGLIYAGHNPRFGEIWWFYPRSGESEPSRYFAYSYREGHWITGQMDRSAWDWSGSLDYPVACGTDGYLYRHETELDPGVTLHRSTGVTVPTEETLGSTTRSLVRSISTTEYPNVGAELHPVYVESGAVQVANGDAMMRVTSIITDSQAGDNGLRLKFQSRDTPDDTAVTRGPFALTSDGYTDVRFTGRQMQLRIESPFDTDWRLGELRAEVVPGGVR
jgi:hypothetical protein